MTASIPTTEPTELRAGDTWRWTRALADYPASAWALKYRFKHPTLAGFEIVAIASGDTHSIIYAAASSASVGAGDYSWIAWVEGGTSEKYTVDQGVITVKPDYRAATAAAVLDERSHARIVLAAIEAVIEGRATIDQEGYEIAGRSLKRTPIPDLLKLRQTYRAEVRAQQQAERIQNGTGVGGRIQFRQG